MILKGRSNVAEEHGSKSHGGVGSYSVRTLMTKEFDSGMKYTRELILEPGASIGDHRHTGDEEIYFIASGSGVMLVDGEECVVTEGDLVLTKDGSSHGLRNTGKEGLRIFVACVAVPAKK